MTIEDRIKEMLVEHGMLDEQATAVMEVMKADKLNELMLHRWNDNIEDCPSSLLAVLWMKAKATALKYIDANCPEAFFRSMFCAIPPPLGFGSLADGAETKEETNVENEDTLD